MKKFTQIFYIVVFTLAFALSQKNNDESRPYEFGFTIDGQQHRHEKKDVKGIIEGEFGFITADGIYHVTVYATDENGKFKILSMKNLRISAPLDGSPLRGELSPEADKYRKQAGLAPLPQSAAPPQAAPNPLAIPQSAPQQEVITTPKNKAPFEFTTQATVKPACASCGFVTTPKPKPGQPGNGFQFQNPIFQKQDQENHQQQPFGQPESEGPLSVSVPIPSSEAPVSIEHRFNSDKVYQPQGPQTIQSIGGQQQSSQNTGSNLPQYQVAKGPQNTHYNAVNVASGAQYPSGGTSGAQYPSGEDQGSQYPNGGTPAEQYPSGGDQGVQYANGGDQGVQYPSRDIQGPQYPSGGNQGTQFPVGGSQGAQYPSGGISGGQYPSGGNQGAQYPSGEAQYPSGGNSQDSQYPSGPIGDFDSIGGIGPNYQQNGLQANPLQVPQKGPSTEVSNFPPVTVSDGVIHVGGKKKQDIPIKDKYPGMQDGLPAGIEDKDVTDILYKFHYTIGFHGHYEKGLKNGAKVGGYFVNGRDGISRVVTYVADENGYRPKVKFINLGLTSDETPKPETEKTFGLKSFEFVWYPVE